jgi:hypothetical protein
MAVHTLPKLRSNYVLEGSAQVEFWASQIWVYIYIYSQLPRVYVSVYKRVRLKCELQHIETWRIAVRPPRRVYHRPAIFFRHIRIIALSFPQGKFRRTLKKFYVFLFFILENVLSLKLHNLELRESGSVSNSSPVRCLGVDNCWQAAIYSEGRDGMIILKWNVARCLPVWLRKHASVYFRGTYFLIFVDCDHI